MCSSVFGAVGNKLKSKRFSVLVANLKIKLNKHEMSARCSNICSKEFFNEIFNVHMRAM